jgi:holo-[acyl-carrier protein] synthase
MTARLQDIKTAVGVDIIEINRIKRAISRWQDSFLNRIYTPTELLYTRNVSSLAARFAAKEAVMKALGTGTRGVGWKDIEILTNAEGAPLVRLYGRALKKSKELSLARFQVSLSHSRKYAIAFVIGHAE